MVQPTQLHKITGAHCELVDHQQLCCIAFGDGCNLETSSTVCIATARGRGSQARIYLLLTPKLKGPVGIVRGAAVTHGRATRPGLHVSVAPLPMVQPESYLVFFVYLLYCTSLFTQLSQLLVKTQATCHVLVKNCVHVRQKPSKVV